MNNKGMSTLEHVIGISSCILAIWGLAITSKVLFGV